MTVFYLSMVGMFALAFGVGYMTCELIHAMRKPEPIPQAPETPTAPAEPIPEPTTFAVAGKPKKPPFRERKKDLRAAARTERKKLEEWRD